MFVHLVGCQDVGKPPKQSSFTGYGFALIALRLTLLVVGGAFLLVFFVFTKQYFALIPTGLMIAYWYQYGKAKYQTASSAAS